MVVGIEKRGIARRVHARSSWSVVRSWIVRCIRMRIIDEKGEGVDCNVPILTDTNDIAKNAQCAEIKVSLLDVLATAKNKGDGNRGAVTQR